MKALVLGGGGAFGSYEAGVATALLRREKYDLVCGVSIGAINAALICAGKDDGLVMATFIPDFISEEVRLWMEPIRIALANDPVTNRMEMITAHERTHGPRPQATLAQLADHIEYIAGKVGPKRVGIGSDFFGVPTTPVGLEDVSRYPYLLAELFRRGWSDSAVAGIAGRNFIRVFRAVEREGERLRARAKPAVRRTEDFAAG